VGIPELKRNNHFLPRGYLKRWAGSGGKVWSYRLLVSHPNVPQWKQQSTRGLAYQEHLYTRLVADKESDEIERWLDREFESPAEEPFRKAISNEKLTPSDWRKLIRFVAAQDARTPARLIENMKRWNETLQTMIDTTLEEFVKTLESGKAATTTVPKTHHPYAKYFPGRVTIEKLPGQKGGQLQFETVVGRGLWIFSIKQLLTTTLNALERHKWTVLRSPPGVAWLTSDDPVVKLNYQHAKKYDFGGGWGSKGTEIFFPLSPNHLMYTKIGERPPPRNSVVPTQVAQSLQKLTVEHAHRLVFATRPEANVVDWRPRTINSDAFKKEREQWHQWNKEQSDAERDLS
jgi:hypothetical protein